MAECYRRQYRCRADAGQPFDGIGVRSGRNCPLLHYLKEIAEIAGLLDLSEKTVEFHKHHIMDVFNLKSNADVVLFALKRGLISVNIVNIEPDRRAHAAHIRG